MREIRGEIMQEIACMREITGEITGEIA